MEYCDGGDLSSFIRERHKLPEQICRRFSQQLALALKYLRNNNVSHMDLKPQNLLLMKRPCMTLKVGGSYALGCWENLRPLRHGSDESFFLQISVSPSTSRTRSKSLPSGAPPFTWRRRFYWNARTTHASIFGASAWSCTNACSAKLRILAVAFRNWRRKSRMADL